MKTLFNILEKEKPSLGQKEKLVELIAVVGGFKELKEPTLAGDLSCTACGNKQFHLTIVQPGIDNRWTWLCADGHCGTNAKRFTSSATTTPLNGIRSLQWPLFCEMNGIGDEHHDVRFDRIKQSEGKIDYMLKFATAPRGIILMRGDPGTGKTYAAMAICEFFTRTSPFCIFTTQKQMANDWVLAQGDRSSKYLPSITSTPLLVIDDFATGEPNPKFLEFFMDLINSRLQWKGKGTVITTNRTHNELEDFCKKALSDRISTGQVLLFQGESRRTKTIL